MKRVFVTESDRERGAWLGPSDRERGAWLGHSAGWGMEAESVEHEALPWSKRGSGAAAAPAPAAASAAAVFFASASDLVSSTVNPRLGTVPSCNPRGWQQRQFTPRTATAGCPLGPSCETCKGGAATTRNPRALPQDRADQQRKTTYLPRGTGGRSRRAGSNSSEEHHAQGFRTYDFQTRVYKFTNPSKCGREARPARRLATRHSSVAREVVS